MRKVKFKKWISGIWGDVYEDGVFQHEGWLKGTNCWETDFKHDGIFHQWANAFTELDSGVGNDTVALIELSDGTILKVMPSNIKFVEPLKISKQ